MKKLSEMKAYFQDLFESCQLAGGFEKSIFDCTERARFEMFCETLGFIYGDAFKDIRPTWTQEALEHFYSGIADMFCVEMCPECGNEEVVYAEGITECPDCGYPVAPCSQCESCDYSTCLYGCDGTENDGHKEVTNPKVTKEFASRIYKYL